MNIHSQARSTEYHALQTKLQKRTSNGIVVPRLTHLVADVDDAAGPGDWR